MTMTNASNAGWTGQAAHNEAFLAEYSTESAVRKYAKHTAGLGINYLLDHEYGDIYRRVLREYIAAPLTDGIRLLEFGCGAGMNLLHCLGLLQRAGISLAQAYGADFSERLVSEARREASTLPEGRSGRVQFMVARNECLIDDMSSALRLPAATLAGTFQMIIGVNTFRYCYRLGLGGGCARQIFDLLAPGGVCVMIDMNNKFPMFRTRMKDKLTRPKEQWYLPKLAEYAAPFAETGFQVLERKNFCWIPHSAGPRLLTVCRVLTPALNTVVPSFAMRSLVISRKPVEC
jgi:SAM-dependent methyltransferase